MQSKYFSQTFFPFLSYLVIKSFVTPRRIDGIQKLLKQKKYSAAIKLAKSISAKDELSKSITALNILGGELKQIQQFLLTTQTEEVLQRNIIIIEKISQTPKQYIRI